MNKDSNKFNILINGYSDLSLTHAGIRSNFNPIANYGVYFKVANSISVLFPYLNAEIENAKFFENPESIQFIFDMAKCTVYPTEVIAVPFTDKKHALDFIERLITFFNDLYIRRGSIKPNYKKFKSISVVDVLKLLPGTNCKECGFTTCMAFAAALSQSKTTPDICPHFTQPIHQNAIYPLCDSYGNLRSTITIEINPKKREEKHHGHKNKISSGVASTGVRAELTQREVEVLRFLATGATNTDISTQLSISHHTVKSHVVHIFNKLGVNDRTQAAVWAAQNKIL